MSLPPFLRLPTELRYTIYDFLCPPTPVSYPYTQPSPLASISHPGPPLSLLTLNHFLYSELCEYYFSRCVFRFVAQSFSSAGRLREDMARGSLGVVRRMRNVEMLLLPGTMRAASSLDMSLTTKGMGEKWLGDQVALLREEARELRTVVVSMRRVSWNHDWSMQGEMEALLMPLEGLKGRVEFKVGEVMGPADIEEEMVEALRAVLEELNK